ncbi:MAG: bile acid:sodium symporter family protein [Campylobacter sp.]|nr:bile acid:sodium symporter family protein [Campylobacter sp.]
MLRKISLFVGKYIAVFVILATLFALFLPEYGKVIKTSWVNYILGLIMFGMGLTVKFSDFKELFVRPKFVIIGILSQFIVMPSIAFFLVKVFNLSLELAIGIVLVGTCPGGTSSNVITYLSRGDLALSVAITSCTTLLAPIMTPFLTYLLISQSIEVDTIGMFISVVQVVLIPIVLGIVVSRFFPKFTHAVMDVLPLISTLGIIAILVAVVSVSASKILANIGIIFLVVILHNLLGYLFGFIIGKIFKANTAQIKALCVEVGMQNSGLASGLALAHFAAYPLAAVPGALFSVWHNISGGILAGFFARKNKL